MGIENFSIVFITAAILTVTIPAKAQNSIVSQPISNMIFTTSSADSAGGATNSVKGNLTFNLLDTINVNKISVSISSSNSSGGDLFSRNFDLTTLGNYNDGTSCIRKMQTVTMTLGKFTQTGRIYCNVTAQLKDGSRKAPMGFSIQPDN